MRPQFATPVLALSAATALLLAMTLPAAAGQPAPRSEEFHYQWKLGNLLGKVAGLFFPSHGDGVLTFTATGDTLRSELLITSEASDDGEFWRYGAESDRSTLGARRAWSAYLWRGKTKEKNQEIEEGGVKEVTSGIYAIRRDPPTVAHKMDIWSDGKIYPVLVIPRGAETREVAGCKVPTHRFTIRGYDAPGARRWKGSLDLWLADDPGHTPVEIRLERNLANLNLELIELPAGMTDGTGSVLEHSP